uniref:Uncharacterized protein n=1 Tax=Arundo donax TaxID=35708 RepID=A0A0A9BC96_ARUDO
MRRSDLLQLLNTSTPVNTTKLSSVS